jgi:hypothetical protein
MIYWPPLYGLELLLGYLTASWLFGVEPSEKI